MDARKPLDVLPPFGQIFLFDGSIVEALNARSLEPYYAVPARAAVCYSLRNSITRCLTVARKALDGYETAPVVSQRRTLGTVVNLLRRVTAARVDGLWHDMKKVRNFTTWSLPSDLDTLDANRVTSALSAVKELIDGLAGMYEQISILVSLLSSCLETYSLVYEFCTTCLEIIPDPPFIPDQIEGRLLNFLLHQLRGAQSMGPDIHQSERLAAISPRLLPFFSSTNHCDISSVFRYIASRNSDAALFYILKDCDLKSFCSFLVENPQNPHVDYSLETIWTLCDLMHRGRIGSFEDLEIFADQVFLLLHNNDHYSELIVAKPSVFSKLFKLL